MFDKEKSMDWLRTKIERGKEELVKFSKISKLKLEISTLRKRKDERYKAMGKRAFKLVEDGILDDSQLVADYDDIIKINQKIEDLELEIKAVKDTKSMIDLDNEK
jgi:predicted  nucleic acid-binding Zn-ribbon protein